MIESYSGHEKPIYVSLGFRIIKIPLSITSMGTDIVELIKRYPDVGYKSLKSDMIVTILEGRTYLFLKDGDIRVFYKRGAIVSIPQDTHHYWEPAGKVLMQMTNSPPYGIAEATQE